MGYLKNEQETVLTYDPIAKMWYAWSSFPPQMQKLERMGWRKIRTSEENGKATRFQRGNEAAKAGRKDGVASGTVRREYASFREAFRALMTDEDRAEIYTALMEKAKAGDVRAAAFLRDTMGEKSAGKEPEDREIVLCMRGISQEAMQEIVG